MRVGLLLAALLASSASAAPLPLRDIAPGVWLAQGEVAAWASQPQAAHVANLGAVVGERCVAVIDTGGSMAVGRALREAIAARTPLPVCWVINTHMHPDHVLGNAAFAGAGPQGSDPQVVAHARAPAALGARLPHYLRALRRDLAAEHQGDAMLAPTLTVADRHTLDLGNRRLELRAWPTAHTDHDLTVFEPHSGTFWSGDLLFVRHLPVLDGKLLGWLSVLDAWVQMPLRNVVPGHGAPPTDWRAALAQQRRYLGALRDAVRTALREGRTLEDALQTHGDASPTVDLQPWLLTQAFHKRNLTAAFAELEWETLPSSPMASSGASK